MKIKHKEKWEKMREREEKVRQGYVKVGKEIRTHLKSKKRGRIINNKN